MGVDVSHTYRYILHPICSEPPCVTAPSRLKASPRNGREPPHGLDFDRDRGDFFETHRRNDSVPSNSALKLIVLEELLVRENAHLERHAAEVGVLK